MAGSKRRLRETGYLHHTHHWAWEKDMGNPPTNWCLYCLLSSDIDSYWEMTGHTNVPFISKQEAHTAVFCRWWELPLFLDETVLRKQAQDQNSPQSSLHILSDAVQLGTRDACPSIRTDVPQPLGKAAVSLRDNLSLEYWDASSTGNSHGQLRGHWEVKRYVN